MARELRESFVRGRNLVDRGRWIGFKTVIRNVQAGGSTAVKMELFIDEALDGRSWRKVYEIIDDGSMGGDSGNCGGSDPAMPITWAALWPRSAGTARTTWTSDGFGPRGRVTGSRT